MSMFLLDSRAGKRTMKGVDPYLGERRQTGCESRSSVVSNAAGSDDLIYIVPWLAQTFFSNNFLHQNYGPTRAISSNI